MFPRLLQNASSCSSRPPSPLTSLFSKKPISIQSQRYGLRFASSRSKRATDEQDERTMELASGDHEGSIIATQSGLFKLLLPLPVANEKGARQEENVLFLLHPKQPLSHVAALIRAELLTADPKHPPADPAGSSPLQSHGTEIDNISFHGRFRDPQDVDAAKSSGRHRLSSKWAMSTEIGDFVRDSTRHSHFQIALDSQHLGVRGHDNEPHTIPVKVPTFEQRTRFLRQQLRGVSQDMQDLMEIKKECDQLAYRDARRFAYAGLGGLGFYWFTVYYLTFKVWDWDVMEPITYLCGLTTVGAGYAWFLHHQREVSYRTVFELSTSRRQSALYDQKGFDRERWQDLVDEATQLRRTIQTIARDYDHKWSLKDEAGDHGALDQEIDEKEQKDKSQRAAQAEEDTSEETTKKD